MDAEVPPGRCARSVGRFVGRRDRCKRSRSSDGLITRATAADDECGHAQPCRTAGGARRRFVGSGCSTARRSVPSRPRAGSAADHDAGESARPWAAPAHSADDQRVERPDQCGRGGHDHPERHVGIPGQHAWAQHDAPDRDRPTHGAVGDPRGRHLPATLRHPGGTAAEQLDPPVRERDRRARRRRRRARAASHGEAAPKAAQVSAPARPKTANPYASVRNVRGRPRPETSGSVTAAFEPQGAASLAKPAQVENATAAIPTTTGLGVDHRRCGFTRRRTSRGPSRP